MSGGDKKFSGLTAGFLLGGKTTKATKPRVSPPPATTTSSPANSNDELASTAVYRWVSGCVCGS